MEVTKVTYPNFKKTPPTVEIDSRGFIGRGVDRNSHKSRSVGVQPLSPKTK